MAEDSLNRVGLGLSGRADSMGLGVVIPWSILSSTSNNTKEKTLKIMVDVEII